MNYTWKLNEGIIEDTSKQTYKNVMKTRRWLKSAGLDGAITAEGYNSLLDIADAINNDLPDADVNRLYLILGDNFTAINNYRLKMIENIEALMSLAETFNVKQAQKAADAARRKNSTWDALSFAVKGMGIIISITAPLAAPAAGIASAGVQVLTSGILASTGATIAYATSEGPLTERINMALTGASIGSGLGGATGLSSAIAGTGSLSVLGIAGAAAGAGYTAAEGGSILEILQGASAWGGYGRLAEGGTNMLGSWLTSTEVDPAVLAGRQPPSQFTDEQWNSMSDVEKLKSLKDSTFTSANTAADDIEKNVNSMKELKFIKDQVSALKENYEDLPVSMTLEEKAEWFDNMMDGIEESYIHSGNADLDVFDEIRDRLRDSILNPDLSLPEPMLDSSLDAFEEARQRLEATIQNNIADADSWVDVYKQMYDTHMADYDTFNRALGNALEFDPGIALDSAIAISPDAITPNLMNEEAMQGLFDAMNTDDLYIYYIAATTNMLAEALRGRGNITIQASMINLMQQSFIYNIEKIPVGSFKKNTAEGFKINGANTMNETQDTKTAEQNIKFLGEGLSQAISAIGSNLLKDFELGVRISLNETYEPLSNNLNAMLSGANRVAYLSQPNDVADLARWLNVKNPLLS